MSKRDPKRLPHDFHLWTAVAATVDPLRRKGLLKMAAGHGLIRSELAERCRDAYRAFRRLQHGLRLNGAQYARVPAAQVESHAAAVRELWAAVFTARAA